MIKVDGHDCWHELLNNKRGSALNTIRMLRAGLSKTDSICVEVSWLNISLVSRLFDEYLDEFPNILYALYYRSPKEHLNPNYALENDINYFNEWMNKKHPIKTDFLDLRIHKQKHMSQKHVELCIDHLKNNIFWSKNSNYPDYFEVGNNQSSTYYKFYKIISEYKIDGWSIEKYHNIIKENTVEYPNIVETIRKELRRAEFDD